ncbi:MAG: hypothetical protein L6Q71_03470 [Planctomycetes bacterium]|nr:hypothetical protein [Planctomycetota bacterium]
MAHPQFELAPFALGAVFSAEKPPHIMEKDQFVDGNEAPRRMRKDFDFKTPCWRLRESNQLTNAVVFAVDEFRSRELEQVFTGNSDYVSWDGPLGRQWFVSIVPPWLGACNWAISSESRFPALADVLKKLPKKEIQEVFSKHAECLPVDSPHEPTQDELFEGLQAMGALREAFSDIHNIRAYSRPNPRAAFELLHRRHNPTLSSCLDIEERSIPAVRLAISYWAKKKKILRSTIRKWKEKVIAISDANLYSDTVTLADIENWTTTS